MANAVFNKIKQQSYTADGDKFSTRIHLTFLVGWFFVELQKTVSIGNFPAYFELIRYMHSFLTFVHDEEYLNELTSIITYYRSRLRNVRPDKIEHVKEQYKHDFGLQWQASIMKLLARKRMLPEETTTIEF